MAETVELVVRIGGLCMFTPRGAGKEMHVVMPKTDGVEHDGHENHGGGADTGIPGHTACLQVRGARVVNTDEFPNPFDMKGWELDLRDFADDSRKALPYGVFNLRRITRKPLSVNAPGRMHARVRLASGAATHTHGLAVWRFPTLPDEQHPLAHWIRWHVADITNGEFQITLRELAGATTKRIRLVPTGAVVTLAVAYLPTGEHNEDPCKPPPRCDGWPCCNTHLPAFYALYDDPASKDEPCVAVDGWPRPQNDDCREYRAIDPPEGFGRRGRTYTCFTIGDDDI